MHNEIFNCFRQVETTTTRQYSGSGLGLSISKAYIELLGGRIWLTSEPEKGSAFYFTIPFKPAISKSSADMQSALGLKIDQKKARTFLIAEDQDSNFMVLKELLSALNVNIIRALNGIEAIEICKNQPIDLILMDIKMPMMDGYEATKRIKEFLPNIPIIAQTAYTMNEEKERALQAGCDNYLTKPFKKADLLALVNQYGGEDTNLKIAK
jgi:CheY-like chemotaxis protein